MQDNQGHILALTFRSKSLKPYQLFPPRSMTEPCLPESLEVMAFSDIVVFEPLPDSAARFPMFDCCTKTETGCTGAGCTW